MSLSLDNTLQEFTELCRSTLKESLAGLYLHGSAAMGCWNEERSDIDLIVLVYDALSDETKCKLLSGIVSLHTRAPGSGIETSIVLLDAAKPFVYPTPYELHFSNTHVAKHESSVEQYLKDMHGEDRDLAAHFRIIRERGIRICGLPIGEAFGDVSDADYLDSILYDVCDAVRNINHNPVYYILNLCRVLAFAEDGLVLSKAEGGIWWKDRTTERFRGLIENALLEYNSPAELKACWSEEDLLDFAAHMLERLSNTRGALA